MSAAAAPIALAVDERDALLDEPLLVRAAGEGLSWRARYRDDDGRVWRAAAGDPERLGLAWAPAKAGTGSVAALRSLRPVSVDVRAEAGDGRAASRTLRRLLVAPGVRVVRWRDGTAARLCLPPAASASSGPPGLGGARPTGAPATVLVDATAGGEAAAALAAPLLASRGAVAVAVSAGIERARELLAAVPAAAADVHELRALDPTEAPTGDAVALAPNVGARDGDAAARAAAWDALLARLGLRLRAGVASSSR